MLALVTGASSGISYSLAKELANRKYDLVVCSSRDRLENAADNFRTFGVEVTDVQADLATQNGVTEFWNRVKELERPVDIACLNAGVGVGGLFHETVLGQELHMIDLNCTGTVDLAKYLVRDMVRLNAGKILFTASIAGEMVAPYSQGKIMSMPPP
jgi:uncharacterized protein